MSSDPVFINTIFNLGDSDLEVDMNVAQGFPNSTLSPYDIIIPKSFADFFGWSQDQPYVTMTFDLLKMILNSDENQEMVDFLFEDDSTNLNKKRQGLGL
jgi:hypothetical protein